MLRSILVPLDGSAFGEHALPLAVSLARRSRASLQVAHVHVPLAPLFTDERPAVENTLDPALKRRRRAYLDGVVARLAETARIPVTSAFLEGDVVEALRDQAAARGADLVVMTTHGRGPLARAWLGSVADELVQRLPIPLLLVRPQDGPPDLAGEPSLQHVLIALDGSRLAEQILEPAVALGTLMQADYTLLQVLSPMAPEDWDPERGWLCGLQPAVLDQPRALHEQERARAAAYLERVAGALRARSLSVQTRVVTHAQPAAAILDAACHGPASMVALQTRGRSGLSRLLLGSVTDKLLRAATVPVLVHHPFNKERDDDDPRNRHPAWGREHGLYDRRQGVPPALAQRGADGGP